MTTDSRTLKRRTLIDIARRRQRAGTGSAWSCLLERTAQMAYPDLTPILSPILWAVAGAAATRLYNPERMTLDLDVVIRAQDARAASQKPERAGFIHQGDLSIGGSSWRAPSNQMIDVIEVREAWWQEALAEAQGNRDAQGLPVLPLRYLVLMNFQAGHVQDIADITRMLGQADEPGLTTVRALFKRFAPADTQDLESLITLGKLERGDEQGR